jgi:predicted NAD-dependent protein-ADP-ribosyltransferase YbiA (DUF1768 family)
MEEEEEINVNVEENIYKEDSIVKEAIQTYYNNKAEYEKKVAQIKENLMKNIRVKHSKPNCIFCERPVGMIFSINIDKTGNKILGARCGDKETPCKEEEKIYTGKMTNYMTQIRNYEKIISDLKIKVILFKNDILFGYVSEKNIATQFEKLKFYIDKASLELQLIKELYMKNVDKYEDYKLLCEKERDYYHEIEKLKTKIHNYKLDSSPQSEKIDDIQDLITSYIETFMPLLNTLMKLRYSINEVDYDPDSKLFTLVQIKQQYDIAENEYSELPIRVASQANLIRPPKKKGTKTKTLKAKNPKVKEPKVKEPKVKEPKVKEPKVKETKKIRRILLDEDEDVDAAVDEKMLTEPPLEEVNPIVEEVPLELRAQEEPIDEVSLMKHEIREKVIHSDIDEDELRLVFDIPELVNREQMYNDLIIFRCSSNSASAPPGEGEGEEIPEGDKSKFKELSRIKDWRRKIANFWTSTGSGDWSAEFTLDGKRWKSVEHYYQASKFKYGHPEFYEKFSLDYQGDSVEGHPELVIAQKPSLAKHAGTDGFYEGIRIRPENVEFDKDFFIPTDKTLSREEEMQYRQHYELFVAQRAKFTTNSKMRTLLLATKDAKLTQLYKPVDTQVRIIEPYYYIMYIRNLLEKANM